MPSDITSETAAKSDTNRTLENQWQDVQRLVYHETMVAYTLGPGFDNSVGLLGRSGNMESMSFEICQGMESMGLGDQETRIEGFETESKVIALSTFVRISELTGMHGKSI